MQNGSPYAFQSGPLRSSSSSGQNVIYPTVQKFTSGSGTYNKMYAFTITGGSATVGATYTNNGVTFTVYATVSSATLIYLNGSGAPTSTGNLTKASGTGDATLTFTAVNAPLYLRVRMVGGGGGGGGSSNSVNNDAGTGGTGGNTTFGSSLLTANGGPGAIKGNQAGGGSSTLNSPAVGMNWNGCNSQGGDTSPAGTGTHGGMGGTSVLFAGAGGGGQPSSSGGAAVANSGSGGGGAGAGASAIAGAGGGGGGSIDAIIYTPSATYAYAVGAAGTAGTAGTGGAVGGAGAAGVIIVEEYYA